MPKARVLAVDDQRYFRELIEGLLCDEGYEVQTASGGEEALHILEREDFEIVITDLVMPGIDGSQLVERIKERIPDQEIVMVTGVVDVNSAVDAMKQGATDYILKPFDRKTLTRSLEKILQRRRLRDEHARLMAENLEYMGVLSLYERAAGLFSTLALEPLAERLIEGLCLETRSQSGVLWVTEELSAARLKLSAARGLIRVEEEPEELETGLLGERFQSQLETGRSFVAALVAGESHEALYVPVRHAGDLVGLARISDKFDGGAFGDRDRAAAEKFVGFGASAIVNALRFRSLERRSFRDPTTRAYTRAYFDDVVRNEIQKAGRFGHRFSLIRAEFEGLSEFRRSVAETEFTAWLGSLVESIGGSLRSTDLLATQDVSQYAILLPETDGLGAAVLKQRVRDGLDESGLLETDDGLPSPHVTLASATYPTDGTQLDALERTLETRLEENRSSPFARGGFEGASLGHIFDHLTQSGDAIPAESGGQIARFLLDEVARRPRDRGLLFMSPGPQWLPVVMSGLERLDGEQTRSEIVLVAERNETDGAHEFGLPLTWVSPAGVPSDRPFLLAYGDGPAYAMVGQAKSGADGDDIFHTSDRVLVERLVFQLQRDLRIPLGV